MTMAMIAPGAEIPPTGDADRDVAHEYLAIIECEGDTWGAYVPDLPGLGVAANSDQEARELIAEAVHLHLEAMREDGAPVPPPTSRPHWVLG